VNFCVDFRTHLLYAFPVKLILATRAAHPPNNSGW
jgi:hypothetical protein